MAGTPRWEPEYCAFFTARRQRYLRTAYAMLGSWAAAEDAAQQTFTALYVRWPRIAEDRVEAYGRRVLVNTCIATYKRRGREVLADEVPDVGVWEDHEQRLALLAALADLSQRDRAVLALRFLEDLPVTEVAEVLGVAEGTVKSQTSRALARLQAELDTTRKEPTT